jgi:hypothetical protein
VRPGGSPAKAKAEAKAKAKAKRDKREHYLDSGALHYWLAQYHSPSEASAAPTSAAPHAIAMSNCCSFSQATRRGRNWMGRPHVVTVYLFDLATRDSPVLLDAGQQAVAFGDMVSTRRPTRALLSALEPNISCEILTTARFIHRAIVSIAQARLRPGVALLSARGAAAGGGGADCGAARAPARPQVGPALRRGLRRARAAGPRGRGPNQAIPRWCFGNESPNMFGCAQWRGGAAE